MSENPKKPLLSADLSAVKSYAKVYAYPCGIVDICAASHPIFGQKGWEESGKSQAALALASERVEGDPAPKEQDLLRSMRRAKSKLRRLALANDFRYFVTLTIDPAKVDSRDAASVVKKLNAWCSNAVQRNGLKYILVPERHKKGGIHFHGFFNDAFPVVDSGTVRVPWSKKPRKPRNEKERGEWLQEGGRIVYNLPGWSLGFTTALDLYGNYPAAVSYVCKYIGKDGTKTGGRWYYSGGDLKEPQVKYVDISPAELRAEFGNRVVTFFPPGKQIAVINGINVHEQVQKGGKDASGSSD